jgi:hypothetical protein
VLSSVELHDEPALVADEVRDVARRRALATELEAEEASIPEVPPELALRVGRAASQLSSEFDGVLRSTDGAPRELTLAVDTDVPPSPTLSPLRGEREKT